MTIPLFAGSTSFPLVTAASTATLTCPTNTDCANYTLLVPGSNPRAGTFSSSGTSYSAPTGNAAYSIEADVTESGLAVKDGSVTLKLNGGAILASRASAQLRGVPDSLRL